MGGRNECEDGLGKEGVEAVKRLRMIEGGNGEREEMGDEWEKRGVR